MGCHFPGRLYRPRFRKTIPILREQWPLHFSSHFVAGFYLWVGLGGLSSLWLSLAFQSLVARLKPTVLAVLAASAIARSCSPGCPLTLAAAISLRFAWFFDRLAVVHCSRPRSLGSRGQSFLPPSSLKKHRNHLQLHLCAPRSFPRPAS